MKHSNTEIARTESSARNELMVLAESALQGERSIGLIRLALVGAIGAGQLVSWLARGAKDALDPAALGILGAYAAFGVVVLALSRRAEPNPERLRTASLLVILLDFVFVCLIALRFDGVDGHPTPEIAASACAVALAFSVARWGAIHVGLSVLLAIAAFTVVATSGGQVYRLKPFGFVVASFLTLGLLLWRTNVQVRRMFVNLKRREDLSRFLPRALVEQVLRFGDTLIPAHREVTVLFLDIRDFTRFSEQLPPQQVLAFLDEFLGELSRVVLGHDGTVNKFLGDGFMAFWGAPVKQPDHALKAVRATLDIRRRVEELNRDRARDGLPPVQVGMGLHSGTVAAGMLGTAEQHEYTVVGDAVNLASRIETLTKAHKIDLLVSQDVRDRLGERFACERLGEEQVKGRTAPVVVYAVRGPAEAKAEVA